LLSSLYWDYILDVVFLIVPAMTDIVFYMGGIIFMGYIEVIDHFSVYSQYRTLFLRLPPSDLGSLYKPANQSITHRLSNIFRPAPVMKNIANELAKSLFLCSYMSPMPSLPLFRLLSALSLH